MDLEWQVLTGIIDELRVTTTIAEGPLKGKVFTKTRQYTKITQDSKTLEHRYHLLQGRNWVEITKEQYEEAMSKQRVEEVRKQLSEELQSRILLEMKKAEREAA